MQQWITRTVREREKHNRNSRFMNFVMMPFLEMEDGWEDDEFS